MIGKKCVWTWKRICENEVDIGWYSSKMQKGTVIGSSVENILTYCFYSLNYMWLLHNKQVTRTALTGRCCRRLNSRGHRAHSWGHCGGVGGSTCCGRGGTATPRYCWRCGGEWCGPRIHHCNTVFITLIEKVIILSWYLNHIILAKVVWFNIVLRLVGNLKGCMHPT